MMYNFIKVKLYRLKTSNNYLKLIKLYHFFFGETFKKKIRIPDFYNNKKNRIDVVNKNIEIKKFNDYLEIGCDQDELFNRVKIRYKTGVDPHSGGTHRMTSDSFFKTNNLDKLSSCILFSALINRFSRFSIPLICFFSCALTAPKKDLSVSLANL